MPSTVKQLILAVINLVLIILIGYAQAGMPGCPMISKGVVCPLIMENVVDIEKEMIHMNSAQGCQYMCYRDGLCSNFTYFSSEVGMRCIMFRGCESTMPCFNCVTGPGSPAMGQCDLNAEAEPEAEVIEAEEEIEDEEEEENNDYYEDFAFGGVPRTEPKFEEPGERQEPQPVEESRGGKQSPDKPEKEMTSIFESIAKGATMTGETEKPPKSPARPKRPRTRPQSSEPRVTTFRPQQLPRLPKQLDDDALDIDGVDEGLLGGEDEPPEIPLATEPPEPTPPPPPPPAPPVEPDDAVEEVPVLDVPEEPELPTLPKATPPPPPIPAAADEAFPDDYFDEPVDDAPEEEVPLDEGVTTTNVRPVTFYHCMLGGYGPAGPVSAVGHVGAAFIHRLDPIIPPLPPSFPLGSQGVYASVYKKTVFTCSPGAAVRNAQFFSFFGQGQRLFQPGQCYSYNPAFHRWQPFSSPMNSYRGGASVTRMGRFFVASGGNRFPAPLSSIEVLNTRKPERWRTLSKLTLPNPTYDHCSVAINKTTIFVTGGFGQESQAIMLDLRDKKSIPEKPMRQPRRKHACVKARVNGREGVIVAGGASDASAALSSLEFFDLGMSKWLNLGRMREGRRFPGLMVMGKHLLVAGGETTDAIGRTVILDSMETLIGKRWTPLRQKLPERRSRFSLLRIPRKFVGNVLY